MKSNIDNTLNQGIGSYIHHINDIREEELKNIIKLIRSDLKNQLTNEEKNLLKAFEYVENVKEFVSNPNNILGSQLTKHGEIAEQVDVNIGNARKLLKGMQETFTFDGVGRTAPEDFLDGNVAVQSKFYNGINNTLKSILEHKDKYNYFGSDGHSYYLIPKDQYDIVDKIMNGKNVEGLSTNTINAIKRNIQEIENEIGAPFHEAIRPSHATYDQVQLGNINKTLEDEKFILKNQSDTNKETYRNDAKERRNSAIENSKPSLNEGAKVAGVAAAFNGSISLLLSIHKKNKEGKSISEFTIDDWKDVGIDTSKGAIKGGISGISVYTLTNFTKTPAPLASAYVSATFGMIKLANEYKTGKISSSEFIEGGQIICMDSAISVIGASLGSLVIPVPVLGAVIGSIAASTMSTIGKQYLDNKEQRLINEYNMKLLKETEKLDKEYSIILANIMQEYYRLGEITAMAFDFDLNSNLRFRNSINLAKEYNLKSNEILNTREEIISYFTE